MQSITLDMLSQDSVSVRRQKYAVVDGQEYPVGQPWRRAYVNSAKGRERIQRELPDPYLSAVMAVWGETPTVTDDVQD